MGEFLTLLPPPEALALFLARLPASPQAELLPTSQALGRVTFDAVTAPIQLPSFIRSTVDGYAVKATETHGASEALPAYLTLAGEILMGEASTIHLAARQCALIHTGGMLPAGADAVVMIEHTQTARQAEIEIMRAVGVGENVMLAGEDVKKGEQVMDAGIRLRPAEIGGLMALGLTEIDVTRQPKVGILSSGDEVIPPGQPLAAGQIYDINSYTLQAQIQQAGGIPAIYPIIPDELNAFTAAAEKGLAENDLLIFTAGSSVSARDLTARAIEMLGEPGILVHGVNVRPGKPTILAVCAGKGVIGLPGNPVSASVIASLFVVPAIAKLSGLGKAPFRPRISAKLTINLASQAGREDWVGAKVRETKDGYQAQPIFGKSGLIFTLSQADGLIRIPSAATGVNAGELVELYLL